MTLRTLGLASFLSLVLASSAALAEGDAEEGKRVYNKCKTCHVVDAE